jgi:DNA-binding Lrp family transcriptional regulator
MDELDKKIASLLQEDAKMTIKKIADKLNMTTTPIYERIKRMERNGVIDKYVALLNPKKSGKPQIAFCNISFLQFNVDGSKEFEEMVQRIPEILECYYIAGEVDYQLKVLVRDMEHYDKFIRHMASIKTIKLHSSRIVLHTAKYSTAISFD